MSFENDSVGNMKSNKNLRTTVNTQFKELGNFLLLKLKSPFTIIGLIIIIFLIIVSIFPMIITPYSLSEANGIFSGVWAPPSVAHPLGQTKFGRDVLARIIYGIPNSLLPGIFSVLIGLAGALIIGIPINIINKRLNISAEIILILIFMIPLIPVIIYSTFILSTIYSSNIAVGLYPILFGIYFIPIFVYFFAKEKFSFYDMSKTTIRYTPLLMGYSILFYNLIAFIGFANPIIIQLGTEINEARNFLYAAPWASFFPGIAIFILVIGFFLLYAGLQVSPKELRQSL